MHISDRMMRATLSRRRLLEASSAFLIAASVGGIDQMLWPHEARAKNVPVDPFSEAEALLIEKFGSVLVTDAAESGLVHFLAAQLNRPHADSLLILRYLDVPPPYLDFYRSGLKALNDAVQSVHKKSFASLDQRQAVEFVKAMMSANPVGWSSPVPAPLFYFVVRADAVDVVYGTMKGFEKLNIPYMGHIDPTEAW